MSDRISLQGIDSRKEIDLWLLQTSDCHSIVLSILAVDRTIPLWSLKRFTGFIFWTSSGVPLPLGGCPRGVMVKALDCGIVVREFVFQSRYYVHFRANTLGKSMNPLILPQSLKIFLGNSKLFSSTSSWYKTFHLVHRSFEMALSNPNFCFHKSCRSNLPLMVIGKQRENGSNTAVVCAKILRFVLASGSESQKGFNNYSKYYIQKKLLFRQI